MRAQARTADRAAFLAACAAAVTLLLAGCLGGPEPEPTGGRRAPTFEAEEDGPWRPGHVAPGRGAFVNANPDALWVVQSGSCACGSADRLVAVYRDGSVLAATYRVEGNTVATTNQSAPYKATLQALFDRSNPFGSHDYAEEAGRGDRGVTVLAVWTGTLMQSDQERVMGHLSRSVRDLRDLPLGEPLDCACAAIRVETLGAPWQSRADALTGGLPPEWQSVAAQMDLLEGWVRGTG